MSAVSQQMPEETRMDMNSVEPQTQDQASILSASLGLSTEVVKFIYSLALTQVVKFMNYFLTKVKDTIESIAPMGDAETTMETNQQLMNAINIIIQSPEFQQKWEELSETLAQLLKVLLSKVEETTSNEGQKIIDNLRELVEKNTKNTIYGVGNAGLDAVCSLPPLVPFCSIANVVSVGAKVGTQTFVSSMQTINQVSEAFSKILGDTAMPIANTFNKVFEFVNYVKELQSKIEGGISGTMTSIQQKLEDATPKVPSFNLTSTTTEEEQPKPYENINMSGGNNEKEPKKRKTSSKKKSPKIKVRSILKTRKYKGGKSKQNKTKKNVRFIM